MRIALVDTNPKPKVYPLPLLKLGAWRKSQGDECVLFHNRLPEAGQFDAIWLTTTFTYDIPHSLGMAKEARNRADAVLVGGVAATLLPEHFERVGLEVHKGLVPDAEQFAPDYSLLGDTPEYSITHTSRGCVRKCSFCMVHRLEPDFAEREAWERDISPHTSKVLFYDNNWFAKGIEGLGRDVARIRALMDAGRITEIDFNQGLDCRLMTEEIADLLQGLPLRPVRFAFDGMQEDGYYQRAVEMMVAQGYDDFLAYVLYNFTDTPKDFYYRLRESVRLQTELDNQSKTKLHVQSFPMCYQPILEADSEKLYTGKHWTAQKKMGFRCIRNGFSGWRAIISAQGGSTMSPMEEFEYWLGKDADEFDRMLAYPRICELTARKKGALRMRRAATQ